MWQEVLKPHVESGALVVIGVVQEQHPDRAKLYRQWRKLDWPIYVDALNLLGVKMVPVPVAIDQAGIVRHERLTPSTVVAEFVRETYPSTAVDDAPNRVQEPSLPSLVKEAPHTGDARAWRRLGDAHFLFGGAKALDQAVEAYERAVALDPDDGRAQFRLGVVLRSRYESATRRHGDAQASVERWGRALKINPNQYIWRRRIEQYGPRLDKPYNFYFWVEKARQEILARGEQPVPLSVEPTGSEIAAPARDMASDGSPAMPDPDPSGRVHRDAKRLVAIESVVTPARVAPGGRVRVRVTFRLNEKAKPLWNNESRPLMMSLAPAKSVPGWSLGEGQFTSANATRPETRETRAVEFELVLNPEAQLGLLELPAYALYSVCESTGGKCFYLRQDFGVVVGVERPGK